MLSKFLIFKKSSLIIPSTTVRNIGRARLQKPKTKPFDRFKVHRNIAEPIPLLTGDDPVPGISAFEFIDRRQKLLEMLIMTDTKPKQNHMMVLPSTATTTHSSIKQNVNMLYLTGIDDKKACLVILYISGGAMKTILFHDTLNVKHVGGFMKAEDLGKFGFDELYPYSQMPAFLHGLFKTVRQFRLWYHDNGGMHELETAMVSILKHPGVVGLQSPVRFIHRLRLIKSPSEISLIKRSSNIITTGFNKAMEATKSGVSSYTLETLIHTHCEQMGGSRPGNGIAGEDPNKIRMSEQMNSPTKKGELVLIDTGCEYNTYTTFLTRTWPVSGEFKPLQKLMYSALYKVQQYLIDSLRRGGNVTLDQLYNKMCIQFGKELRSISFMKSATASEISKMLPALCPGNVAHFAGMEINDCYGVPKNTPLVPGMVFTLKPGIVIPQTRTDVSENYRGFCMQLQDNILVTPTGIEVLTINCKSSPIDIQKVVGSIDL